jgi:general secretion pathway protein I
MSGPRGTAGFTLIEILVALIVAAVSLAAASRAALMATDNASTLRLRTLASWVAQNRLAARQIEPGGGPAGSRQGRDEQAGVVFTWRETATATANPLFRRVEISVRAAEAPGYELARLVAYAPASGEP